MEQELMLVENLPISEKEIQIPSKELNTIQKSQYLKNIEGTRDEIVRKIEACKEYKKKEFLKAEKAKILKRIENGKIGEALKQANAEIEKYNKIVTGSLRDCSGKIEEIEKRINELVSGNKEFAEPSIGLQKLEELKILNAESCVKSYSFESDLEGKFEKEQGKLFESKKKLLQTHYKLMQDALLYYNVDRFKKLLMRFFKLRDDINKIYIPIIKSQEAADYE